MKLIIKNDNLTKPNNNKYIKAIAENQNSFNLYFSFISTNNILHISWEYDSWSDTIWSI